MTNIGIEDQISYSEVRLKLKDPPPRKIRMIYSLNGDPVCNWNCLHDVLLIKSGEMSWYIDLTFEQFGLERTFWKGEEYYSKYADSFKAMREPGANRRDRPKDERGQQEDEAERLLNEAIYEWAEKNVSLQELVEMDEKSFQEHKSSLLRAMDEAVKAFTRDRIGTWAAWHFRIQMMGTPDEVDEVQQHEK